MSAYLNVLKELPEHVQLVAVSKTRTPEEILAVYNEGHRIFGENKALELRDKAEQLPKDIEWHFIGHLQRNKVKYIVPSVSLIHSIDSGRLLEEVNRRAAANGKIIDVLFQIHIAKESAKFGFSEIELREFLEQDIAEKFPNIRPVGLMGMATHTEDDDLIRSEFHGLNELFTELIDSGKFRTSTPILSMGMSIDRGIAIDEGSNMVRIGTSIFGPRQL